MKPTSSGAGRLPGLGPVFAFERVIASRRWQGYAIRSLFVAGLLAALVVVWAGQGANSFRGLAQIGETFFIAVTGTQLTLVLLAAPAATAGAICLDRSRGALAHLLVTDLSDVEIVLGKLAARLVPVLGLVACTAPLLSLLQLLGGIDPDALLGAFVVTLGVAVLGCCLALAFSLWAGKAHEALLGTYAVFGLWLLGRTMITQFGGAVGASLPVPPRLSDPFALAFAPYWWPGTVGWGDYLTFLAVTLALSAGLAALAVVRLRPVCTRETVRKARRGRPGKEAEGFDRPSRLPGPSLDGNPVLWREWHRNRPSRWARLVGVVFVGLAAVFSAVAIATQNGHAAAWTNGLQVSIGLLLLSVTAATSLGEERVRGSLDVLLATPLSTREIVLGKWLGSFRLVPALAVLPTLVILCGHGGGVEQVAPAVLTAAFVLCSGAAVTSLGLALATGVSRLGRAVGLTVTLYVLVTVGWLFLVMALIRGGREAEGAMMLSPFFWAGNFAFDVCAAQSNPRSVGWAFFWTLAYAAAAFVILGVTLASFNRCLGRVDDGFAPPPRRGPKPVRPAAFEEVAGRI
jgi:ABC-type transport system involved in multi-copper enzyme maturation permease subunit